MAENKKLFLEDVRRWSRTTIIVLVTAILSITFIRTTRKVGAGSVPEITDALKGLYWPLVACVSLIVLRHPIGAFLIGVSQRITKLSAFKIEFELSDVIATEAKIPALGDLKRGRSMLVGDSTSQLYVQLAIETPADYVLIDLAGGNEWITSRIYIVAALFDRMRGVRSIASFPAFRTIT